MKSEYLDKNSIPLREYYDVSKTVLKSETYLVHMVYIIYRYSRSGSLVSITINGVEYPPETELVFDEETLQLHIKKA